MERPEKEADRQLDCAQPGDRKKMQKQRLKRRGRGAKDRRGRDGTSAEVRILGLDVRFWREK
jgi:hypothetical protein